MAGPSTFDAVASGIGLGQRDQALGLQRQSQDNTFNIQQQELALRKQGLENQQHRELLARADKQLSDLMGILSKAVEGAKQSGQSNQDITSNKGIQQMLAVADRLSTSAGGNPGYVQTLFAGLLAQPANPQLPTGGGAPSAPAAASAPTIGGQSPFQTTMNLTGPGSQVTGIDMSQPVQNLDNRGNVVSTTPDSQGSIGGPAATPAPAAGTVAPPAVTQGSPQDEVSKWTNYLTRLRADTPPAAREVAMARLKEAMRAQSGEDIEVKTIKDENQNEHVVFINKRTKQVTGPDGQP